MCSAVRNAVETISGAASEKITQPACTKFCHAPVDGLHSIENTGGYNM